MKTKKEYREWRLESCGNQHNIGVAAKLLNGAGGWDDLQVEPGGVVVIEASAVSDLLAELKVARDALDMLTIGEENRSRLDEVSNLGLMGALKQMDSISRDALTRANNFLKQWEDGDEAEG